MSNPPSRVAGVRFSGNRRCSTQDWAKIYALRSKYPITIEAFDITILNGEDLTKRPYLERKDQLAHLLSGKGLQPTIYYVGYSMDLEAMWNEVKTRDEEGLILKDLNSAYEYERSYKWLKLKNWKHDIVDVIGYTPGQNSRAAFFGALVLAKDGKYVGCAGSGPNEWELRMLKDLFSKAPRTAKPFDIGEPYTAVDVKLKAEVKYYKHTERGVFRFPVFIQVHQS